MQGTEFNDSKNTNDNDEIISSSRASGDIRFRSLNHREGDYDEEFEDMTRSPLSVLENDEQSDFLHTEDTSNDVGLNRSNTDADTSSSRCFSVERRQSNEEHIDEDPILNVHDTLTLSESITTTSDLSETDVICCVGTFPFISVRDSDSLEELFRIPTQGKAERIVQIPSPSSRVVAITVQLSERDGPHDPNEHVQLFDIDERRMVGELGRHPIFCSWSSKLKKLPFRGTGLGVMSKSGAEEGSLLIAGYSKFNSKACLIDVERMMMSHGNEEGTEVIIRDRLNASHSVRVRNVPEWNPNEIFIATMNKLLHFDITSRKKTQDLSLINPIGEWKLNSSGVPPCHDGSLFGFIDLCPDTHKNCFISSSYINKEYSNYVLTVWDRRCYLGLAFSNALNIMLPVESMAYDEERSRVYFGERLRTDHSHQNIIEVFDLRLPTAYVDRLPLAGEPGSYVSCLEVIGNSRERNPFVLYSQTHLCQREELVIGKFLPVGFDVEEENRSATSWFTSSLDERQYKWDVKDLISVSQNSSDNYRYSTTVAYDHLNEEEDHGNSLPFYKTREVLLLKPKTDYFSRFVENESDAQSFLPSLTETETSQNTEKMIIAFPSEPEVALAYFDENLEGIRLCSSTESFRFATEASSSSLLAACSMGRRVHLLDPLAALTSSSMTPTSPLSSFRSLEMVFALHWVPLVESISSLSPILVVGGQRSLHAVGGSQMIQFEDPPAWTNCIEGDTAETVFVGGADRCSYTCDNLNHSLISLYDGTCGKRLREHIIDCGETSTLSLDHCHSLLYVGSENSISGGVKMFSRSLEYVGTMSSISIPHSLLFDEFSNLALIGSNQATIECWDPRSCVRPVFVLDLPVPSNVKSLIVRNLKRFSIDVFICGFGNVLTKWSLKNRSTKMRIQNQMQFCFDHETEEWDAETHSLSKVATSYCSINSFEIVRLDSPIYGEEGWEGGGEKWNYLMENDDFLKDYSLPLTSTQIHDKLVAGYTEVIENPEAGIDLGGLHYGRACSFIQLERFNEALSDLDVSILQTPSEPEYHRKRMIVCMKLKNYTEAINSFVSCHRLGLESVFVEANEKVSRLMSASGSNHPSDRYPWQTAQLQSSLCQWIPNVSRNDLVPLSAALRKEVDCLVGLAVMMNETQQFGCSFYRHLLDRQSLSWSDSIKALGLRFHRSDETLEEELRSRKGDFNVKLPASSGIAFHVLSDSIVRWVWKTERNRRIVSWTSRRCNVTFLRKELSEFQCLVRLVTRKPSLMFHSKVEAFQKSFLSKFYTILFGELGTFLDDVDTLNIVPDSFLFEIPFGCLLDSNGRYFCEKWSFAVYSSVSLITLSETKTISITDPTDRRHCVSGLIFGDPIDDNELTILENSSQEIRTFVQTVGSSCHEPVLAITGSTFTPDHFFACCQSLRPRFLHVSTHASGRIESATSDHSRFPEFEPTGSLRCSFSLRVESKSILSLDLSETELVFLNACESGLGRVVAEGVQGFYRSFLHAGAKCVIATLWPVVDLCSRRISDVFYEKLLLGDEKEISKAEALRLAIIRLWSSLQLRGRQAREFPILWGAFQCFGA